MRGIPADGQTIQRLRLEQALTQEGLAAACRISGRTLRKAEKGERVDMATLSLVASRLGVEIDRLVFSAETNGDRHVQATKALVKALLARDLDRVMRLHHARIVLEAPGTGVYVRFLGGPRLSGAKAVRRHYRRLDRYVRIDAVRQTQIDAKGSLVFHRCEASLREMLTGVVVQTRLYNELEFVDGKIQRRLMICDLSDHRNTFSTFR